MSTQASHSIFETGVATDDYIIPLGVTITPSTAELAMTEFPVLWRNYQTLSQLVVYKLPIDEENPSVSRCYGHNADVAVAVASARYYFHLHVDHQMYIAALDFRYMTSDVPPDDVPFTVASPTAQSVNLQVRSISRSLDDVIDSVPCPRVIRVLSSRGLCCSFLNRTHCSCAS